MGRHALTLSLSSRQRALLNQWANAHKTSQQMLVRVRIILLAAQGLSNVGISAELGITDQRARRWRRRWVESQSRLAEAESHEATSEADLARLIDAILSDEYRSGTPPRFSAEQMTQLIALACEDPTQSGCPVTHWTPKELAAEAIQRDIVASISIRHLDRFLK